MKKLRVLSALLALAAIAVPAGPALADFVPVGSLLFQDTYNYTEVSLDLNVNINSPSRVSGPLAGQVAYDQDNMVGAKDIDGPNQKLDLSDGGAGVTTGRVGLTKDFNNELALGGMTVCATVNPRGGYAGIGVGHNGSTAADIGDNWDVNFYLVPGLYFDAFDGVTVAADLATTRFASDGTAAWLSDLTDYSGGYSDFVELAMVFTDQTDNNPFNGSGTIDVAFYANGELKGTASGPDFAHNYISFQERAWGNYASFKDLRVYGNVPEPGALTLLAAAAGFAFVWFRRRR
ncbi:MAG: PEP-CTERM sorting domain-containing protein [Pirellulales bacterium]|nr:PEP-CTERM sorting domain-containing protein [Pirellulales bacterium]